MAEPERARAALRRYAVAQTPGLALVVLVSMALHAAGASTGVAVGLCALWIAKDALLYRWLRASYEGDERPPVERLVGRRGVVTLTLAPEGYVRVGAELWRARAAATETALEPGTAVDVVGARDLTLLVARRRARQSSVGEMAD